MNDTTIEETPFTHRSVRDLAWVIASPPLVSGEYNQTSWWSHTACLEEFNACLPALRALDKNPHTLLDHLKRIKSKRLGLYFEGLVSFWLSSISPNYRLLAQNIQLFKCQQKGKHTLGELDFIIQQRSTQKVIHLEVAVKFYLGTEPLTDTYRWFGTNTNDQLGRKLDQLKQNQTQLSKTYPGLLDFYIDEKQCLLKGRLFYPAEGLTPLPIQQQHLPEGVNTKHLRGRWMYSSPQDMLQNLIMLNKDKWLAELGQDEIAQYLQQHLQPPQSFNLDRPTCYSVVESDTNKKHRELERIFILPKGFMFPTKKP